MRATKRSIYWLVDTGRAVNIHIVIYTNIDIYTKMSQMQNQIEIHNRNKWKILKSKK